MLSLENYPEIACYQGMHILHSAITLVFLIIFICLTTLISYLFFDSRLTRSDINVFVRNQANERTFENIYKTGLCFFILLFNWSGGEWLLAIYMLASLASIYWSFGNNGDFFFNNTTQKIWRSFFVARLWTCFVFLITLCFGNEGMSLLPFCGVPFCFAWVFSSSNSDWQLLALINNVQTPPKRYRELIIAMIRAFFSKGIILSVYI